MNRPPSREQQIELARHNAGVVAARRAYDLEQAATDPRTCSCGVPLLARRRLCDDCRATAQRVHNNASTRRRRAA